VGYKIDHGGGSFGSAIDCVVAAVALSALIVAFAPFAVFRGAKRVGDRMIERDRDERGDGFESRVARRRTELGRTGRGTPPWIPDYRGAARRSGA
jgi:hypothetical protein